MPEPDFTAEAIFEPEETGDDYELLQKAGLGALADALEQQRRDSKGMLLPLFKWRPLCPPFHPEGNLRYQALVPHCRARIKIVTTANRGGKTTSGAIETVGRARGAHPLFGKIKYNVPQNIWVGCNPKFVKEMLRVLVAVTPPNDIERTYWSGGEERIEFKNGSIIKMKSYGMPREEWQMEQVNFLWLDEEPPEHIWEEAMTRLNAEDSQCLITATLVNASPFLFDVAEQFPPEGKDNLEGHGRLRVSWFSASMYDNPTLPDDYIKAQEHLLRRSPEMFKIRALGEPTELAGLRIFKDVLPDLRQQIKQPRAFYWFDDRGRPKPVADKELWRWDVWETPKPNMRYVIGADLSEGGIDGDWTAAHVICVDTSSVVAKFRGKIEPGPFGRALAYMGWWYNTAVINWEWNMQGAAVGDRLVQMRYRHLARQESFAGKVKKSLDQYGFRTTGHSKHAIVTELRDALGDGVLVMPDQETYDELTDFGYLSKANSPSRMKGMGVLPPGQHDDMVMSLAISWYTTRFAASPRKSKYHPQSWGEEMFMEWEQSQKKSRRRNGLHRGVLP